MSDEIQENLQTDAKIDPNLEAVITPNISTKGNDLPVPTWLSRKIRIFALNHADQTQSDKYPTSVKRFTRAAIYEKMMRDNPKVAQTIIENILK